MVSFNSRISPLTSTVILRDRSPRATAVVTSAMLRTCAVRFAPMMLTESVRSFHVPATPGTTACTPRRPSVPAPRAAPGAAGRRLRHAEAAVGAGVAGDAGHLGRERAELFDHRVDGLLELQDLAADVDG